MEVYSLVAQMDRLKMGDEPRLFFMGFITDGAPFMDMAILLIENMVNQQ